MNTNAAEEPRLSGDFADRVLAAVDRRLIQQRRRHRAFAAGAVCLAVAAAVAWRGIAWAPQPDLLSEKPMLAATSAPAADVRTTSTDPLSYMFPDAEPLARFAAEDGAADGNEGAGALFDESE